MITAYASINGALTRSELAGGAPLPVAHAAGAYPSKPIRIIVNASPGGAPDDGSIRIRVAG